MKFIVTSDLHFGSESPKDIDNIMYHLMYDVFINSIIVTGDLTGNGYDGKESLKCLSCIFGSKNILVGGDKTNELGLLQSFFINPIHELNKKIYLIQGDSDRNNGACRYPVRNYIRSLYGKEYYSFVSDGVLFLMCDIYPNKKICGWIHSITKTIKIPTLIFFHYNLEGSSSNLWSEVEKHNFYETVKDVNVLAIFCGHEKRSYTYLWNNIKVYDTSGTMFMVVTVNTGSITNIKWA